VRDLLGPDARPTICSDRGGSSPKLFAELVAMGFDILTYRKGPLLPEPRAAFSAYQVTGRFGHGAEYLLADRAVRIYFDNRRHYFACRQVTRLDLASAHQTQMLRADLGTPEVASAMFNRWREEDLSRSMRPRGQDALGSYAKVPDDPARMVPNPAKARMKKDLAAARAALAAAKATNTTEALEDKRPSTRPIEEAEAALAALRAEPAKAPPSPPGRRPPGCGALGRRTQTPPRRSADGHLERRTRPGPCPRPSLRPSCVRRGPQPACPKRSPPQPTSKSSTVVSTCV
jgi:hypothetical protein